MPTYTMLLYGASHLDERRLKGVIARKDVPFGGLWLEQWSPKFLEPNTPKNEILGPRLSSVKKFKNITLTLLR